MGVRLHFLCFSVLFLLHTTVTSLHGNQPDETPLIIGTNKQLFIDDRFIETSQGVSFTVNPPVKVGPIKLSLQPTGYVGVVEYDGTCFMYYMAEGGYAVATSKDGVNWKNPISSPIMITVNTATYFTVVFSNHWVMNMPSICLNVTGQNAVYM